MFLRIYALIVKEFLAILKDPKSRFIVIAPPVIQLLVFGYAATYDLRNLRCAVLDRSRTPESHALVGHFRAAKAFRIVENLSSTRQFNEVIDQQRVRLILHIGDRFAEDLQAGRTAALQVILDGRESNVSLIGLGYVRRVVERFNLSRSRRNGGVAGASPGPVLVQRAWFNRNLKSRWFITSALGGVICMVVVMVLTCLSVAREREFGTFDQLLVAPYAPGEILAGKAIPPMVLGLVDGVVLSFVAVLWFGVPFRGSFTALVIALGVFVLAIVGVGLFISSLSRTMQQGLLGAFVFMMPSVILSGFATPLSNMPGWLRELTRINPVRYIVSAMRKLFLEGAALADIGSEIWPLALIACATLPVAAVFFRHRAS